MGGERILLIKTVKRCRRNLMRSVLTMRILNILADIPGRYGEITCTVLPHYFSINKIFKESFQPKKYV